MTKPQLNPLKTRLEAILHCELKSSAKREAIAVQQTADALDETQLATERELAISLLNRESLLVQNVRAALQRIKEGTYGVCVQCDEPIIAKRLQAVPWTQFCLKCQEELDGKGLKNLGEVSMRGIAGGDPSQMH